MAFPPQFLDELRARLPVSEVVGRRVKLRKAGREWKALSPFNQEKTPSFTVNDQKGFFHDFSSGKHGDIFGFVMETEGLTFPEAVERLFEPFQRLGSARVADDGHYGLGLSIAQAIATAHDAAITAKPQPEGGLMVTVTFPVLSDGTSADTR